MENKSQQTTALQAFDRKLANSMGITQQEYRDYTPVYHSEDNPNGHYYEFPPETPEQLLVKIAGIQGRTLAVDNHFNTAVDQMDDPGPDGSL